MFGHAEFETVNPEPGLLSASGWSFVNITTKQQVIVAHGPNSTLFINTQVYSN